MIKEIELKYTLKDRKQAEEIWEDPVLYAACNLETRESVCMSAIYFDTRDSILARSGMSLRIRREGEHSVLSIKNKGITENGLHRRDENNMPYTGEVDENTVFRPDRDMLAESELGSRLLKLIDDRDLYPVIHMNYLRRRFRMDSGDSFVEVAIDTGEISTETASIPVCELEIELYSGDVDDMIAFGNRLANRYGIEREDITKYARGLELLENRLCMTNE